MGENRKEQAAYLPAELHSQASARHHPLPFIILLLLLRLLLSLVGPLLEPSRGSGNSRHQESFTGQAAKPKLRSWF